MKALRAAHQHLLNIWEGLVDALNYPVVRVLVALAAWGGSIAITQLVEPLTTIDLIVALYLSASAGILLVIEPTRYDRR